MLLGDSQTFIVYFTIPPHSISNPYGMDIFHGFHMDSRWNILNISSPSQIKIEQRLKNIKISEEIMYINCID